MKVKRKLAAIARIVAMAAIGLTIAPFIMGVVIWISKFVLIDYFEWFERVIRYMVGM